MKERRFTREEIARASRKAAAVAHAANLLGEMQRRGVDLTPGPGLTARIAAAMEKPQPRVSMARLYRILEAQNPYRVRITETMIEGFDRIPGVAGFPRQCEDADRMTAALLDNMEAYKRVPA